MKEQPVPGGSCEDSWVVSHFFLLLCVVCSSPVTSMEKADCWGGSTGLHCTPGGFAPLPSTVLRMDCDDHMVPFSLSCTFRRASPCSSVFLLRDDFCFCKSVKTVVHLLLRGQHQCAQIQQGDISWVLYRIICYSFFSFVSNKRVLARSLTLFCCSKTVTRAVTSTLSNPLTVSSYIRYFTQSEQCFTKTLFCVFSQLEFTLTDLCKALIFEEKKRKSC